MFKIVRNQVSIVVKPIVVLDIRGMLPRELKVKNINNSHLLIKIHVMIQDTQCFKYNAVLKG